MDELFNEDNLAESNWFAMEKVGDKVGGILVEVSEAEGNYGPQRIYSMKQDDGQIIKYGVSLNKYSDGKYMKEYVLTRAATASMGDWIGFQFKKEVESKRNPGKMAKSIEVYVKKGGAITDDGE